MKGFREEAAVNTTSETATRVDRMADRLAAALADAMAELDQDRSLAALTDEQATTALATHLAERGLRVNDEMLRALAAARSRTSGA